MKKLILNFFQKAISIMLTVILFLQAISFEVFAADPKVSIIIPVYNTPKSLLINCLESAKNQTLKDIEIICVDDGSTDGSGKILDEYAKIDPRFVIVHQENGGCAVARNKGMTLAKGEYIQFLDSDDKMLQTMSEKCYCKAKEFDADIVRCGSNFCRVKDNVIWGEDYNVDSAHSLVIWNGIWKAKFLKDNNLKFDESAFSRTDTSFSIICNLYAQKVATISENLYIYQRYSKKNSICEIVGKNIEKQQKDQASVYKYIMGHIDFSAKNKKAVVNFLMLFMKYFKLFGTPGMLCAVKPLLKDDVIDLLPAKERLLIRKLIKSAG